MEWFIFGLLFLIATAVVFGSEVAQALVQLLFNSIVFVLGLGFLAVVALVLLALAQ